MLLTTAYNSSWSLLIKDSRGNQYGEHPIVMAAPQPYIKKDLNSSCHFLNQVEINGYLKSLSNSLCEVSSSSVVMSLATEQDLISRCWALQRVNKTFDI